MIPDDDASMRSRTDEGGLETVTIIPARGGSKGLPRKNLRLLGGQPLVARTIDCARHATMVTRVVVSTDDDEIAAVARTAGADVVRRPVELSGDRSRSEDAILHALDYLRGTQNYEPDLIAFLQCTSPLTAPADVDGAIRALLAEDADCAVAVTPAHATLWRQCADRSWAAVNLDPSRRPPRQLREPEFQETGAAYVMKAAGFVQARNRFFGRIVGYVMPRERAIEVDDLADLEVAETWLRLNAQSDRRS